MNEAERKLELCVKTCAERAWRLALTWTNDPAEADDVVQQAFIATSRKIERIPAGDMWPWLAAVVVNEARNARRSKLRRERRTTLGKDEAMEHAVSSGLSPDQSAAREEVAALLRAGLETLDEDEREAVIMTSVMGMSAREAGEGLSIPHSTVNARANRGLSTLRARLKLSEASMVSSFTLIPCLPPPGGLEAASLGWLSAAKGALAAGAGVTGSAGAGIAGGAVMASKTTIAAALVVALGIGAVSGVMVAGEAADKPPALEAIVDEEREAPEAKQPVIDMTQYVPRQEFDALQKSLATINSDKDKQAEINTSALDQLKRENRDLLTKIAELEHKLNPPLKGEDLAIVFGDYNGVENLREVDWDKAGEAMIKMIGLMDQLYRSTKTGQRMDPKAMSELQTENNKLIDVALKVMGEVPSNIGNINGEFTHPIVTANILAAHLEAAGLPLSADQHETIAGYGQDFVVKWDKANKSYTDKTFKIEKIMDEVKLKEEFMAKTKAALTPAQLQLLGTPDISGISMFDIYSPLIALQGNFHDVTADSSGDTKSKIADAISSHTEMPKEDVLIRFGPVLDTWTTEFSEKLQPATAIILQTYNVEEVIIACKAQMKATEDILELLSPAPELERSIRDNASIIIGKLKINDK